MSDYMVTDGLFVNSIVGEGSSFKGSLNLKGLLRIDGDFSGTIEAAQKVLVGKTGRAESQIQAGTVVIGGVVKGNIVASEKVVVLSSGMVLGNITAPRIVVEDGVFVHGACRIVRGFEPEEAELDDVSASEDNIERYNPLQAGSL